MKLSALSHAPRGAVRRAYVSVRRASRRRTIFIAAVPKSGSTWLTSMLSALPNFRQVAPPAFGGRRELEVPHNHLIRPMLVARHLVDCQHVRASQDTLVQLALADAFPVVLTRNVADALVSMHDHISGLRGGHREASSEPGHRWSMAYLTPQRWLSWGEEQRYRVLTRAFLPWYANFELSWRAWAEIVEEHDFDRRIRRYLHPPLYLDYDTMRSNPEETLDAIAEHVGLSIDVEDRRRALERSLESPTRRNVAVTGRGRELCHRLPFVGADIAQWSELEPTLDWGRR